MALLARDAATLVPNLDRALADAGARRLASRLETPPIDSRSAVMFEDGALDDDARARPPIFHDVAVSLAALVRCPSTLRRRSSSARPKSEDVEDPGGSETRKTIAAIAKAKR